ncbi:DEAD/DEAH box helicase [Gorillibacterium sp. sgz500922]|uniref:DEAD/DEAH box helicase n=1 Tax=Gorillibacterium sp. sgz500922 TaxID=3446694 RepID=UPI003F6628F0
MTSKDSLGVFGMSQALHDALRSYLESTYHIKNLSLINERRELLQTIGYIHQEPFVESTPSYELGRPYSELEIPQPAKDTLTKLSKLSPSVGVFQNPFSHQSEALETFLGNGKDIIVATGTGSGKTESFLMPIIGELANETSYRHDTADMFGCRAILLYPMNALVNDQLGRIRRLFGNEKASEILKGSRNRPIRFGSYTSRTPYPGELNNSKNNTHIAPLFEDFYLKQVNEPRMVSLLKEKGKWPSKDLVNFYAKDQEEQAVYQSGVKSGKKYIKRNWHKRLKTQPSDRELLTRHEMHESCPDVFITNYSMLEYMLIRPIERPIFNQTKAWLESNSDNKLILVLDEAHMYRGTGGAEVALLIRRLMARLGIGRDRLRCILTSASLGESLEAENAIKMFAAELTGLNDCNKIELVKGVKERRSGASCGTTIEAEALAKVDLNSFQNAAVDPAAVLSQIEQLGITLGWSHIPRSIEELPNYMYTHLENWGPAEMMIISLSGRAVPLKEISETLFPHTSLKTANLATEVLIALGAYAKRADDNRVFLPTRLHLFYRGLPGLYACINPECTKRLSKKGNEQHILGRLYTTPRLHCSCDNKARVYELLTHRDCGAAFIRGYIRGGNENFLLNEPTSDIGIEDEELQHLKEIQLLVDGEPHPDALINCVPAWLDITTGHLMKEEPKDLNGFIMVFRPISEVDSNDHVYKSCPICLKKWRGKSKIMDLVTKGEAPFANLVKSQLLLQPPRLVETMENPNGGRKVLLFSDGRQKAARLARDIPREVEWDTFRQAIALAVFKYNKVKNKNPKINSLLYVSFISIVAEFNLHFFDGDDRKRLISDVREFQCDYDGSLEEALDNDWQPLPSPSFYKALLRQICNREYSLQSALLGYVKAAQPNNIYRDITTICNDIPSSTVDAIIFGFLNSLLEDYAFGTERLISSSVRREAAGYPQKSWVGDGKLNETIIRLLVDKYECSEYQIGSIQDVLRRRLCEADGNAFTIKNEAVLLAIDTQSKWYSCNLCTQINPVSVESCCVNCGGEIEVIDPNTNKYIQSRKGHLRNPIIEALNNGRRPQHITAAEHTAQLTNRDAGVVFATTEKYELLFQDVLIEAESGPVDILSCTTTMEVGVDIGSLVAVGLRNVPPQRENYQQRAGRAGRRGSAVSTVITFAQGGPHDSYYFHNPETIVAGTPRQPMVKTDNEKIARRHVHAYLFQTFFHHLMDGGLEFESSKSLFSTLGATSDFFSKNENNPFRLSSFKSWVYDQLFGNKDGLLESLVKWIPKGISNDNSKWVLEVTKELVKTLEIKSLSFETQPTLVYDNSDDNEDTDESNYESKDELLAYLFDEGLLPSYAFPTNLCSFLIEERQKRKGGFKVVVKEKPQQSIDKALSEYAPGRQIVVDKITYRSGGITANNAHVTDPDRAATLFRRNIRPYVTCEKCTFVQDIISDQRDLTSCPICNSKLIKSELLIPEVFHPEEGRSIIEGDHEQDYTYATSAQFPVPLAEDDLTDWGSLGRNIKFTYAKDRRLVMVNKGDEETNDGFSVCVKCGAASVFDREKPRKGAHRRPYEVEPREGISVTPKCDGHFKKVILGHQFQTDLLLLRLEIDSPLLRDASSRLSLSILHDGLRTISEALLLSSSKQLDIDPAEFQAGYRLIEAGSDNKPLRADIYLFDTLSGGAGYAEQAGQQLEAIINSTLDLLEHCPSDCDRSCTNCLRHYKNQYWHSNLDRYIGAALLRNLFNGVVPKIETAIEQSEKLIALKRLLELDGYKVTTVEGEIPLTVYGKKRGIAVGTYNSLFDSKNIRDYHPLLSKPNELQVFVENEYLLTRNIPLVYNKIKNMLEA